MSTPLALQDILSSIADGLSQAQQQLNNMPLYDSFGRPATTYHIPYLDFNISLSTKFNETHQNDDNPEIPINDGSLVNKIALASLKITQPISNQLLFSAPTTSVASKLITATTPVMKTMALRGDEKSDDGQQGDGGNEGTTGSEEGSESFTTISGRFIAVLPNDGLPQTVLHVSYQECEKDATSITYLIKVLVMNTAGEKCAHQRVEFNYDDDASLLLNKETILSLIEDPKFDKKYVFEPTFSTSEVYTNGEGYAETRVSIKREDLDNNFTFVIRVNSGLITKSISI